MKFLQNQVRKNIRISKENLVKEGYGFILKALRLVPVIPLISFNFFWKKGNQSNYKNYDWNQITRKMSVL